MKTLIICYSRTGMTKKVADALAKELTADIEDIISETKWAGVIGWLKAGKFAMQKKLCKIKELQHNLDDYDLIIIGTPVWAGAISPPVRTFISNNKNKCKDVAFFCTQGSSGAEQVLKQMQDLSDKKPKATMYINSSTVNSSDKLFSKVKEFISIIKD